MDHHLHGLAHGENGGVVIRQGPHVRLWVWWRKGLFRQGRPLRRMIFLITPRHGEGGGEPGLKGYVFWSGLRKHLHGRCFLLFG